MNNRSTKLRPGAGLILAGLLAVTLTAYAAQRMNGLQIGPNPTTTNIDLQGDGDIIAAGDLDVGGVITGDGSGITGVTGDALTAAFIEALDPATPVAGDLLVGVDATDGELKQFDIDDLPGGGTGDVVGPGPTVTDNAVSTFDGTGGLTIQATPVIIDPMNGNVTGVGTVDGRDIATDGTKLDGIESGAEANDVDSVNSQTGAVSLDADDIDDAATTNRFVTAGDQTNLGNLSGTNTGDATLSGTPDYITRSGQVFTLGQIDLAADVTGTLPAAAVGTGLTDAQVSDTLTASNVVGSGSTSNAVDAATAEFAGNIPVARHNSGTGADGTTFWRGDGVWALPPVTLTNTVTLTNKRITKRAGSTPSSATPTINTDTYDAYEIIALTTAITSMTSGLSGTPQNWDQLRLRITGTAARGITWGASFADGPEALPLTTVTTKTLHVLLEWDGSIWRCMAAGSNP